MAGKRNELLNFLKGIGCLMVVFIHIPFPGKTGEIIARMGAFAVPIFFMISGYFAYSENGPAKKRYGVVPYESHRLQVLQ